MSKFINPFSDFGFKKIFGSEVSKDLIISFLNGVLHEEVIVNITFRNVELLGMKQDQGKVVFDIFCENEKSLLLKCKKPVRSSFPTVSSIMPRSLSSNKQ